MQLTDPVAIRSLMIEVESERERLQKWYQSTFKDTKYEDVYLFRCKRLAQIRENLKLLAESYEVGCD